MQFYFFHLMPWPHVPEDFADKSKYPSAWVTLSNSYYDPEKGHLLYNRYLDELEYAEKLGFDGVCVNEHHQNTYGTMPAPNIIAALLARRTNRVKIAILGNGIPLRDHPLRVAEEVRHARCGQRRLHRLRLRAGDRLRVLLNGSESHLLHRAVSRGP